MSTGAANILLLVVFIVMIYFMMIRPQRKKDKEDKEMRASLAVGDEVITIGGVIGKVTKITEKRVVVETGAGKNKIEFLKTAIASVSKSDSAKAEAKAEAAKSEQEEEKKPDRDKKVALFDKNTKTWQMDPDRYVSQNVKKMIKDNRTVSNDLEMQRKAQGLVPDKKNNEQDIS